VNHKLQIFLNFPVFLTNNTLISDSDGGKNNVIEVIKLSHTCLLTPSHSDSSEVPSERFELLKVPGWRTQIFCDFTSLGLVNPSDKAQHPRRFESSAAKNI
jgi:hypothetical protein